VSFASFFDYTGETAVGGAPPGDAVLLPDLDDDGWDRLIAHTEVSRFAQGDIVIAAGARDRTLYIVADGVLEIDGPGGGALLESGAVIGELPFFDGGPHPATVRARTDVDLLGLNVEAFEVLAAREPVLARAVLMDLGRILALRLRRVAGNGGAA
jgi:CRP/FNR family transcriptional regulator, cyclic AMP receptor protein